MDESWDQVGTEDTRGLENPSGFDPFLPRNELKCFSQSIDIENDERPESTREMETVGFRNSTRFQIGKRNCKVLTAVSFGCGQANKFLDILSKNKSV